MQVVNCKQLSAKFIAIALIGPETYIKYEEKKSFWDYVEQVGGGRAGEEARKIKKIIFLYYDNISKKIQLD